MSAGWVCSAIGKGKMVLGRNRELSIRRGGPRSKEAAARACIIAHCCSSSCCCSAQVDPQDDGIDFFKLLHGFVKISFWCFSFPTYISALKRRHIFAGFRVSKLINVFFLQNCIMDWSELLQGFFKLDTCFSLPLPNKTKLKSDQRFGLKPVEN